MALAIEWDCRLVDLDYLFSIEHQSFPKPLKTRLELSISICGWSHPWMNLQNSLNWTIEHWKEHLWTELNIWTELNSWTYELSCIEPWIIGLTWSTELNDHWTNLKHWTLNWTEWLWPPHVWGLGESLNWVCFLTYGWGFRGIVPQELQKIPLINPCYQSEWVCPISFENFWSKVPDSKSRKFP